MVPTITKQRINNAQSTQPNNFVKKLINIQNKIIKFYRIQNENLKKNKKLKDNFDKELDKNIDKFAKKLEKDYNTYTNTDFSKHKIYYHTFNRKKNTNKQITLSSSTEPEPLATAVATIGESGSSVQYDISYTDLNFNDTEQFNDYLSITLIGGAGPASNTPLYTSTSPTTANYIAGSNCTSFFGGIPLVTYIANSATSVTINMVLQRLFFTPGNSSDNTVSQIQLEYTLVTSSGQSAGDNYVVQLTSDGCMNTSNPVESFIVINDLSGNRIPPSVITSDSRDVLETYIYVQTTGGFTNSYPTNVNANSLNPSLDTSVPTSTCGILNLTGIYNTDTSTVQSLPLFTPPAGMGGGYTQSETTYTLNTTVVSTTLAGPGPLTFSQQTYINGSYIPNKDNIISLIMNSQGVDNSGNIINASNGGGNVGIDTTIFETISSSATTTSSGSFLAIAYNSPQKYMFIPTSTVPILTNYTYTYNS
jgi:hypothetical protein